MRAPNKKPRIQKRKPIETREYRALSEEQAAKRLSWNNAGFRRVAPKALNGTPPKTSWWTAAAKPGERAAFMDEARKRDALGEWTNAGPHSKVFE